MILNFVFFPLYVVLSITISMVYHCLTVTGIISNVSQTDKIFVSVL